MREPADMYSSPPCNAPMLCGAEVSYSVARGIVTIVFANSMRFSVIDESWNDDHHFELLDQAYTLGQPSPESYHQHLEHLQQII